MDPTIRQSSRLFYTNICISISEAVRRKPLQKRIKLAALAIITQTGQIACNNADFTKVTDRYFIDSTIFVAIIKATEFVIVIKGYGGLEKR